MRSGGTRREGVRIGVSATTDSDDTRQPSNSPVSASAPTRGEMTHLRRHRIAGISEVRSDVVPPDHGGTSSRRQSEPRPASSASGTSRGRCLRTGRHRLPRRRERQSRRRPRPWGCVVVRQTGSRSTGVPSAGCATARPRSSSRFGGRSFTRWVITSESTTPGCANSDGDSAVSIRSSAMCGRLSRSPWVPAYWPTGPSERHVRRSSPAMAQDRVLLIAAIGAGISLLPDASSEPRCQYVVGLAALPLT